MKLMLFALPTILAPAVADAFLHSRRASKQRVLDSLKTDESAAITREEYKSLVHNLVEVMEKTKNQLEKMKYITSELLLVEMINPRVTQMEPPPEKLKRALAEAKAAGDTFGHDSDECDRAWEQVESIVAGVVEFDDHHYRYTQRAVIDHPHDYSAIVDFQSLSDLLESIASIDHTKRLLKLEDSRVNASKNFLP